MSALAPVLVRPVDRRATLVLAPTYASENRPRRWRAAAMAAGGLVLVAATGVGLTEVGDRGASAPAPQAAVTNVHLGPLAITLSGPGDVSTVTQVYEPGQTSGWHAHTGIHAVAVLSGTLTVYDEQCRAQAFGPGQPYIGGQELHLVRNEGPAPVEMVVTYLNPAGPNTSTRHMPAPASCASGEPRS